MTVLAIIEPNTLVGTELRQQLRQHRRLWDEVRLLSVHCDPETATLSELDGAALVQPVSDEQLAGVDLLFACDGSDGATPPWQGAPTGATTIVVQPGEPPVGGVTIVSGVNLEAVRRGGLLVSPHPAIVLLALLLDPLVELGLEEAIAWVLQPATMRGSRGMDELMDQTRALLAFHEAPPSPVFGRQLSFNLLPTVTATAPLARELTELLGGGVTAALEIVQGAVFHSFAASVLVRFRDEPGEEGIAEALADRPLVRRADDPAGLGPIDAADAHEVLVGEIAAIPGRPRSYWLRAVMDNLTRGGALNALEIAAAVLGA